MKRKLVSLFLSLSLMVVSVTGCQSDSVTEETKKEVQTKKSQVLSLYKEIETMIQKNHIEADADFAKMKDKLTSMSKKVDEKIEDTTEEDAKQAITELKRLETNTARDAAAAVFSTAPWIFILRSNASFPTFWARRIPSLSARAFRAISALFPA